MKINAFFDASFYPSHNRGIVAIFIKDIELNRVITRSAKLKKCKTSIDAEFKALYKLVNHLNFKQSQGLIPMNIVINICGDNYDVITYASSAKKYKGLSEQDAIGFSVAYETLKANNEVFLLLVNRKTNPAHGALTNFKLTMKALKQSWLLS